jgi:ATP-dependent helicase HrpA
LQPEESELLVALSRFIQDRYKINIPPASWPADALPEYLRPRFEVVGAQDKPLAAGRDIATLRAQAKISEKNVEEDAFIKAAELFERYEIEEWNFPDPPAKVEIPTKSGLPLFAYPGLRLENERVSLRLFRQKGEAVTATQPALERLAEFAMEKELAWLQRDLRALDKVRDLYITIGSGDELLETAYLNLRSFLFAHEAVHPPTRAALEKIIAQVKERLPGLILKAVELIRQILQLRQQLLLLKKPYAGLQQDLQRLMPKRFLETVSYPQLQHFPRYLKAFQLRAERAALSTLKDQERLRAVAPYQQRLDLIKKRTDLDPTQKMKVEEFRWLIEEFKVSLFAQELGTAGPISPKRLDKFLEEARL